MSHQPDVIPGPTSPPELRVGLCYPLLGGQDHVVSLIGPGGTLDTYRSEMHIGSQFQKGGGSTAAADGNVNVPSHHGHLAIVVFHSSQRGQTGMCYKSKAGECDCQSKMTPLVKKTTNTAHTVIHTCTQEHKRSPPPLGPGSGKGWRKDGVEGCINSMARHPHLATPHLTSMASCMTLSTEYVAPVQSLWLSE